MLVSFLTGFGILGCLWMMWMPIATKMNNRRLNKRRIERVEKLMEFNRDAKSKDEFIVLYVTVMKALNAKMNITKEEFDTLSIDKIRELNEEALLSIREQLQSA